MKTFVLFTKLSSEIAKKVKDRSIQGRHWLEQVKERCPEVKFLHHYALLGKFDFMDIYEAPDDETAVKVALISRANGAESVESMTAIPYKNFLDLTKEI